MQCFVGLQDLVTQQERVTEYGANELIVIPPRCAVGLCRAADEHLGINRTISRVPADDRMRCEEAHRTPLGCGQFTAAIATVACKSARILPCMGLEPSSCHLIPLAT